MMLPSPQLLAAASQGATFATAVQAIVVIANWVVVPCIYALGFIYITFGIVRYFFIEQSEEGREKGKQMILFGLIGLFVLFGLWGIVNLLLNTLNGVAGLTGT